MKISKLLIAFILLLPSLLFAQGNWTSISTAEEACAAWPEQMRSVFTNLDLNRPGLEKVKKAWEASNLVAACNELLDYYGKTRLVSRELPAASEQTVSEADSVMQDIYTFQRVSDRVPRLADGHLKWDFMGPEKDIEWAWALNRHYPTGALLSAWSKTGNPKYARYIDQFTKDWILCSWPYPAVKSSTAMWRGLEVSFRVKTWSKVFYELWKTNLVSPATRLLILSSIPQHAHYARNFHAQGNWLTMEISGLATAATSWPEFRESKAWLDYAVATMTASMKEQVYPDGVQTELTSSYHHVALSNFSLFASLCKENGVALPEYYTRTLEQMTAYLALTMRPDGYGILNNDADLQNNRPAILREAEDFKRPDWTYIATNGSSGKKPSGGSSFLFPWAGQLISRSGYDADAQWSFFDIGPWGSGHQHNDKLHLSVAAFGHDLLVDGGRFAYRGAVAEKFRKYATGSFSHNLILPDGKGQADGPKLATSPLSDQLWAISKDWDYGSGTFDKYSGLEGTFSHTRAMVYLRGKCWVVADHLLTDRPRKIEVLWHWHPSNQVKTGPGASVCTTNDKGNLCIIPAGDGGWSVRLAKGEEKPAIQGWYSKEYNNWEPNPTSVYSRELKGEKTCVWLLWPSEGASPKVNATILSAGKTSVSVRVSEPGSGSWDIVVPFGDSSGVRVTKTKLTKK